MNSEELQLHIAIQHINPASLVLRAINHKLRQKFLKIIHQNGKMTVTEVYVTLRLEQSLVSQHLGILRKAGFVRTQRNGKFIYYSVNYDFLNHVHHTSNSLVSSSIVPQL